MVPLGSPSGDLIDVHMERALEEMKRTEKDLSRNMINAASPFSFIPAEFHALFSRLFFFADVSLSDAFESIECISSCMFQVFPEKIHKGRSIYVTLGRAVRDANICNIVDARSYLGGLVKFINDDEKSERIKCVVHSFETVFEFVQKLDDLYFEYSSEYLLSDDDKKVLTQMNNNLEVRSDKHTDARDCLYQRVKWNFDGFWSKRPLIRGLFYLAIMGKRKPTDEEYAKLITEAASNDEFIFDMRAIRRMAFPRELDNLASFDWQYRSLSMRIYLSKEETEAIKRALDVLDPPSAPVPMPELGLEPDVTNRLDPPPKLFCDHLRKAIQRIAWECDLDFDEIEAHIRRAFYTIDDKLIVSDAGAVIDPEGLSIDRYWVTRAMYVKGVLQLLVEVANVFNFDASRFRELIELIKTLDFVFFEVCKSHPILMRRRMSDVETDAFCVEVDLVCEKIRIESKKDHASEGDVLMDILDSDSSFAVFNFRERGGIEYRVIENETIELSNKFKIDWIQEVATQKGLRTRGSQFTWAICVILSTIDACRRD